MKWKRPARWIRLIGSPTKVLLEERQAQAKKKNERLVIEGQRMIQCLRDQREAKTCSKEAWFRLEWKGHNGGRLLVERRLRLSISLLHQRR